MRRNHLLLIASLALFIGYSVVVTATSGDASFVASPMLAGAIAALVWHDRVTSSAA